MTEADARVKFAMRYLVTARVKSGVGALAKAVADRAAPELFSGRELNSAAARGEPNLTGKAISRHQDYFRAKLSMIECRSIGRTCYLNVNCAEYTFPSFKVTVINLQVPTQDFDVCQLKMN